MFWLVYWEDLKVFKGTSCTIGSHAFPHQIQRWNSIVGNIHRNVENIISDNQQQYPECIHENWSHIIIYLEGANDQAPQRFRSPRSKRINLGPQTAQAAKPYLPYLVPVSKWRGSLPHKKRTLQVRKFHKLKVRIPEARTLVVHKWGHFWWIPNKEGWFWRH